MLLTQNENLLPKSLADGVAPKTPGFKHQLLRFRGYRKLLIFFRKSKLLKVLLGAFFALFLSGYQPTIAIPPIKQSFAQAQVPQEQVITPADFPDVFNLPHPGYLTTKFSSWHPGVDIAAGYGMPIKPIAKGTVTEVVLGFWGLGHYVVVEHEQGFRSTYGHMGKVFIRQGDTVNADSTLGAVGMTGHTSGPHTHLEVTRNGQSIDPLTILPAISRWPDTAGVAPFGAGTIQEDVKQSFPPSEVKPKPVSVKQKLNLINIGKAGQTEDMQKAKTSPLPRLLLSQPGLI